MVQLGEHFASKSRGADVDALRQQRWFIKAREDHQRREKEQDRVDDDFAAFATETVMASQAQIKAFETKLDRYDEATVQALMDNQELLDAVNARIDNMLLHAHVMDDGRRVFRTEDGTQVFDEHGAKVGNEELGPNLIDPAAPSWEAYSQEVALQQDLLLQRSELIEYQAKLDDARVQVTETEMSEADLEALDAELMEMMPQAVLDLTGEAEVAAEAVLAKDPTVQIATSAFDRMPAQSAVMTPSAFR